MMNKNNEKQGQSSIKLVLVPTGTFVTQFEKSCGLLTRFKIRRNFMPRAAKRGAGGRGQFAPGPQGLRGLIIEDF